ncbi:MAG: GAF domain-containing sensor histidine kinase [Planctomycetota bacterium]
MLSLWWLSLDSKGAIFLLEEGADNVLVMKVQSRLEAGIRKTCAKVPFGKCACGKAALTKEMQYISYNDSAHEIKTEDMRPHSHYCVPLVASGKTLGVINVYLAKGKQREQKTEVFLSAVANTLAGILERRRGEEAIKKLEAQKLVVEELKKIDKLKDEFLSMVTHELRTPMTPLKSVVSMFLDGTLGKVSPNQREYLEMLDRNIERVSNFTTCILTQIKLEAGKYRFNPKNASILQIAKPVVQLLQQKAKTKEIEVILDIPEDIKVFADVNAVSDVITNLINNAVVHNSKGTKISVSANILDKTFVEMAVSDNGKGIPEEAVDKIFGRFYQADSGGEDVHRGSGIGLSVCKGLIEAMGGKIYVESSPGKGAAFKFTLNRKEKKQKIKK